MASITDIATSRFNDNIYTLNSSLVEWSSSFITILPNQSLIIPKNYTLVLNIGFQNNGTIINYGTLLENGELNSNGIINNEISGVIDISNTLFMDNYCHILNRGVINILNPSSWGQIIMNNTNCKLVNCAGGIINNGIGTGTNIGRIYNNFGLFINNGIFNNLNIVSGEVGTFINNGIINPTGNGILFTGNYP